MQTDIPHFKYRSKALSGRQSGYIDFGRIEADGEVIHKIENLAEFHKAFGLNGLILTKLDGTAKGGIVLKISKELGIPVKYIGVGEQIDDLQVFNKENFIQALLED